MQLPERAKVKVHWTVSPYDFSDEKMEAIAEKAAAKYGIPKEHVRVEPAFVEVGEDGSSINVTEDVINSIQDPQFQLELFKEYLRVQGIEDCDFNLIKEIDSETNGRIDYQVYEHYRKYRVKWLRFSNFLSYGADNVLDFGTRRGVVLLNSDPANQGGKTTLAVDVLHFLLFGKTDKAETLDKLFNKFLPEASTASVEGCLEIDGCDYVIRRTLTRPQLSKRTEKSKTSQTVEYWKVVGDTYEQLTDEGENCADRDSTQTNKVIREAIGNESDFNLIMSVTDSTLDDLIEKKDTERGRLLARWIGLLPLEEKDRIARERYNQEIKPHLLSNQYNREQLATEIKGFTTTKNTLITDNERYAKELAALDEDIKVMESNRNALLSKKAVIDENLLKIDITTLNRSIDDTIALGKRKKDEATAIETKLKENGDVEFSNEVYTDTMEKLGSVNTKIQLLLRDYEANTKNIEALRKSEYCPTCHRKLDNVDCSKQIAEKEEENKRILEDGKKAREEAANLQKSIEAMNVAREKYTANSNLKMEHSVLMLNLEKLRGGLKDLLKKRDEFNKNAAAIEANNNLDIEVRNTEVALQGKRNNRDTTQRIMTENASNIRYYDKEIQARKDIITKLGEEDKLERNWKIYLAMVGKDGVSKMVLRKALPVINGKLRQLLGDVCDFNVEVGINNRNDVLFYIVKDGVRSNIQSGSGFEKTAAALALRSVLGDLSTVPKNDFIVFDEVFGRVAKDNYDNMRALIDRISKSYQFVIIISHIAEIKDWADSVITVKKEGNISKII